MNTNIQKISNEQIKAGLEEGKIQIDDYELSDGDVNFWFSSPYYDDELNEITESIDVDQIIEKLEEYNEKVVVSDNRFVSLSNYNTWVDNYGNLEEEADAEDMSRHEVLEAIYEIFVDQKNVAINYEIKVSTPVSFNPINYGLSLADWYNKSEKEKNEFVIEIFTNEIGIHHYNVEKV